MEFFPIDMDFFLLSVDKMLTLCYTFPTMIYDNVCMFIPTSSNYGDVHVLHFVRENATEITHPRTLAYYRIHLVTQGEGIFRVPSGDRQLQKGDLFLALPAVPYTLHPSADFRCNYIDCLGDQVNAIAEHLKISVKNCVFEGYHDLIPVWEQALNLPKEVSDLSSKSTLYATFAAIGARTLPSENVKKEATTASLIKKYIDENFTSPDLSLRTLSKHFSYSSKYISSLLTKHLQITFKTYLNIIRIQNACALIQQGFTGVKNIASLCGFTDPLYFSKTFKAHTGKSPTEFIEHIEKQTK